MTKFIFYSGMFPYVMIAVMPIFCDADWPKKNLPKIPKLQSIMLYDTAPRRNPSCIYPEDESNANDTSVIKLFFFLI